jgi:hypothetical protein
MSNDSTWHRARANGGRGLDDALFERTVTRCGVYSSRDQFGEQATYFPDPPEGNSWHVVRGIKDDEGCPATLWRRLKSPYEIVDAGSVEP